MEHNSKKRSFELDSNNLKSKSISLQKGRTPEGSQSKKYKKPKNPNRNKPFKGIKFRKMGW